MKPFDPELAIKGNAVIARDGEPVRVLCIDAPGDLPIVVLQPNGIIYRTFINGRSNYQSDSDADLFMAPVKKEGWMNIYNNFPDRTWGGYVYESKKAAEKSTEKHKIATIKIEWEE